MGDFFKKYAKLIDATDLYLGPINALTARSDDEILQSIGVVSKTINLTLKIPFITCYLAKTKDFSALAYWAKREVISTAIPYGGFIDIGRHYQKKCEEKYK
ncbi:MAG: hypothetical protein ACMXX7_01930 [Candidatus Woesearchaeota archaeon]